MKRIKYIALSLLMLSALSCKLSEIQVTGSGQTEHETVPVKLSFEIDDVVSAHSDNSNNTHTKAPQGTARVVASERTNGMLIELLEQPSDRAASKAADENTIKNLWLFQFNSPATTEVPVIRQYYPNYNAGDTFELLPGNNQRIVIVANTFIADHYHHMYSSLLLWKGDVTSDPNSIFTNSGANMVLVGDTVINIAPKSNIVCKLAHNIANVSFDVKLGQGMLERKWTAQVASVPNMSFYVPNRVQDPTVLFPLAGSPPVAPTTVDFPVQDVIFNNSAYTPIKWYVPVNRRGIVADATAKTRLSKAPIGSTAVRLIGRNDKNQIVYTIPLGANFTTDYNVRPNYKYTYRVTIYEDPDQSDSQVETIASWIDIDGVRWATGNLIADGANGMKIGLPTNGGLYLQFGSLVGWTGGATGDGVGLPSDVYTPALAVKVSPQGYPTTGPSIVWGTAGYCKITASGEVTDLVVDDPVTGIGDACRYYLGGSWRLPTAEEYKALIPSQTINSTSSKFYWSTAANGGYANATSIAGGPNSLFFPAAGQRMDSGGEMLNEVRVRSYCWNASFMTGEFANYFNAGSAKVYPSGSIQRLFGLPVRCVQGVSLSSDKAENTAPAAATTFTVTVKGAGMATNGEAWMVNEDSDAQGAFSASVVGGKGDGTFTVAVAENTVVDVAREASYTLTTASGLRASITLKQKGKETDWILINGLKWAKGNLVVDASVTPGSGVATGTKGTKVKIGKPTDGGVYFQFGSLIGYKGGNAASNGTGRGIPNWQTAMLGDNSFWNGGAAYSWANDAMVWPQAYTTNATTWPAGKTTNDYYFGLGAAPYSSAGQKLSAFPDWESGGLVNQSIAVGDPCRYYLGGAWRMPTAEDWGKLFNSRYTNGTVGGTWPGAGLNWGYGTATKTVMAGIPSSINSPTEGIGIYANTAATTEAAAKADPGALFFPASGYRSNSGGSFNNVGRFGYSWSGSVYNATNGFSLGFYTTYVYPQYYSNRSYGFPVRCVSAP